MGKGNFNDLLRDNEQKGNRLRIANIIEEGKLGGPQVRIIIAAHAMKKCVETIVIMPRENSEVFRRKCDQFDIPYVELPITRITKELIVGIRFLVFSPMEILRLAYFIKSNNFDLVHASGGAWQYKGVMAGWLARRKVLWHLNDTLTPAFIRGVFKLLSPLADGFVFSSKRTKEYYGGLLDTGRPEFVIPAPVDTNYFSPFIEYMRDEGERNTWDGKLVVGTVALVNRLKGIDVLIKVASSLHYLANKLQFVVIGPIHKNQDAYYQRLRKLRVECGVTNLEFVGERQDTRPLLKRFDIYMCTSYAESSPLSVWEAMSMGKAIVSTNVGDVPLYIQNGESGEIVDVGDVDGLADRVLGLMSDEAKRKRYGEKVREIAVNNLDVSICAQKHLDAYQTICFGMK